MFHSKHPYYVYIHRGILAGFNELSWFNCNLQETIQFDWRMNILNGIQQCKGKRKTNSFYRLILPCQFPYILFECLHFAGILFDDTKLWLTSNWKKIQISDILLFYCLHLCGELWNLILAFKQLYFFSWFSVHFHQFHHQIIFNAPLWTS